MAQREVRDTASIASVPAVAPSHATMASRESKAPVLVSSQAAAAEKSAEGKV